MQTGEGVMPTLNQALVSIQTGRFIGFFIIFLVFQVAINMMGPLIKTYTNWYSKRPRTTAYIDSVLKVLTTSLIIFLLGAWILFMQVYWETFLVILIFELI